MRVFLRYWLPVLLWVACITWMSTDAGSPRRTSRFIGPILRWFSPNISDETIQRVQFVVRKSAHVIEYALLSGLLWRARRKAFWGDARPWRTREAAFALAVAVLVALSDEWHQSFVPDRDGKGADVLLDSFGAAAGILAVWLLHRYWRRRSEEIISGARIPSH